MSTYLEYPLDKTRCSLNTLYIEMCDAIKLRDIVVKKKTLAEDEKKDRGLNVKERGQCDVEKHRVKSDRKHPSRG